MLNSIKENSPFNIYDFFGYFFPGVYFTASILWILNIANFKITGNLYNVCSSVYASSPFYFGFILIIGTIAIIYIIGHLIATFSHITIDRLIVLGILDYPINRLINNMNSYRKKHITNKYILSIILITTWIPVILPQCINIIISLVYLLCILLILKFYNINALNSKTELDRTKYAAYITQSKCWKIYSWPSNNILDQIIFFYESVLQTNRPMDPALVGAFKMKIEQKYPVKLKSYSSEYYWHAFYSIRDTSPNNAPLITNWLYLYSFARNIAAASFIISSILIIMLFCEKTINLQGFKIYHTTFNLIGILFMTRYWMLYYTYYSKSIIRIFTIDATKD